MNSFLSDSRHRLAWQEKPRSHVPRNCSWFSSATVVGRTRWQSRPATADSSREAGRSPTASVGGQVDSILLMGRPCLCEDTRDPQKCTGLPASQVAEHISIGLAQAWIADLYIHRALHRSRVRLVGGSPRWPQPPRPDLHFGRQERAVPGTAPSAASTRMLIAAAVASRPLEASAAASEALACRRWVVLD